MNIMLKAGATSLAVAAALTLCSCSQEAQTPGTGAGPAVEAGDKAAGGGSSTLRIAMMPKLVGIDYFDAVEKGAKKAADELKADLTWDGPTTDDVTKQAEMLDTWITQKPDVIAVAPNDPNALAPTLKKAREKGIMVLTYDSDSTPDSRDYFVNQATGEAIGNSLADEMSDQLGGKGKVAIVMGSLTAANQITWIEWITKRIKDKHPGLEIVATKPSEENQQLAVQVTQDLLKAYPDLKGVFAITSVAFPGAAQAVKQTGNSGKVAVVGLATPKGMKSFVDDGTVKTVILWDSVKLGYLTVQAAKALKESKQLGATLKAGELGDVQVSGTEILLGEPMKFTKENIAQYDF